MIMTVIGITLVALLAAVAVAAVNGDAQLTGRDLEPQAGLRGGEGGDQRIRLPPARQHRLLGRMHRSGAERRTTALNQEGSTANRRTVPGERRRHYALELIPATGQSECDSTNIDTATASMLESAEPMKGTFRVRATGFSGNAQVVGHRDLQAGELPRLRLLHPARDLRPGHLRRRGTIEGRRRTAVHEDDLRRPLRHATEERSGQISTRAESHPNAVCAYCDVISFVGGDNIKGPMHTNDAFVDLRKPDPRPRRERPDRGQLPGTKPAGSRPGNSPLRTTGCSGSNPNFKGTFQINSPALIPPETNSRTGDHRRTDVPLQRRSRDLPGRRDDDGRHGSRTCTDGTVVYSGAFPANGVIYDENEACNGEYSPFETEYPETSECGNVYIARHLLEAADDRRRQRHHRSKATSPRAAKKACSA